MAVTIVLTDGDLAEVNDNAGGRNQKELMGVPTNKISRKLTDLELHQLEVKGQLAVSKYFKVPMDWSVCKGGKRTPHFTINGVTMRVQTPTHDPPILKLNRMEDFTTDLMIVCSEWGDDPHVVRICGCVSRDRFLREHQLKDFGEGTRLVMYVQNLTHILDWEDEAGLIAKKPATGETAPSSRLKKGAG